MDEVTQHRWVRGLFDRGFRTIDIAPIVDMPLAAVRNSLKSSSRSPLRAKGEVEILVSLYRSGCSLQALAEASGRSKGLLSIWLRRMGCEMRPRTRNGSLAEIRSRRVADVARAKAALAQIGRAS